MDSAHIGKLIRDTRQALGMRQDELASVAGLSTRTLSDIENGKPSAQMALVLRVLDALGIKRSSPLLRAVVVRSVTTSAKHRPRWMTCAGTSMPGGRRSSRESRPSSATPAVAARC